MVFARLQSHEKDAFFSLLDEYFTSRPDIFANAGSSGSSGTTAGGAAASAVHRALASNPEATSRFVSAGLKHGVPKSSPYSATTSDPEFNSAVGRVAAASLALSSSSSPPAPPRRTPGSPPLVSEKPSSAGLVPIRRFGDVDTSSAKNMFTSLRNSNANKAATPPPPTVPSAFAVPKNNFAPPPARRTPSSSAPPLRQPSPEPEDEGVQGEWAEVLYDYNSKDPSDLEIRENQQVLVTERSSDEWWMGEIDGKRGLFPASYVKLL